MTAVQRELVDQWVLSRLRKTRAPMSCAQLVQAGHEAPPEAGLTQQNADNEIYSSLMRLMRRENAIRSFWGGTVYVFEALSLLEQIAHAAADP